MSAPIIDTLYIGDSDKQMTLHRKKNIRMKLQQSVKRVSDRKRRPKVSMRESCLRVFQEEGEVAIAIVLSAVRLSALLKQSFGKCAR